MKKVIIAIAAISLMASCKKEDISPAPVSDETKNIAKSIYVYDNGFPETETFTYNIQGRIASIINDSRTETFNFVSATSLVVTERFNSNNSLAVTRECTLNEKGYVTKIVIKDAVGAIQGAYDYTYNAEGYIIGRKLTYAAGGNEELVYTIANGNVISSKQYNNNIQSNNEEITYDNAKLNKAPIGHGSYWQIKNLFGKVSKNLRVETKTFNATATLTWHTQISYDMDANGYPAKRTTNNVMNGKQAVDTYIYQ